MVLCALCLALSGGTLLAEESIKDAFKKGEVSLDLRYRYEFVDDNASSEDANASTARIRFGYKTGTYYDFFAYADFEALRVIGGEQYNSTANGLTDFPVVADPEDEEVNQAYVGYSGFEDTVFKFGRQRIILDNHRFIGNVGWRQLEQTYDAFSVRSELTDRLTFFYAHVNNANRIFGENNPTAALANTNLSGDLVNVAIEFPVGTLVGYAYLLDFEDTPSVSQKNIGARFKGKHDFTKDFTFMYAAEYADQSDYKSGDGIIDASYFLGEAGVGLSGVNLKAGYELLEGGGTYAFQTPLATLHAHNGWADKFLLTPLNGLEDLYFSVSGTVRGIKLLGVYHDFSADEGGDDYGTELDLRITWKFREIYTLGGKYASYDADTLSTDTEKLWVWLQIKM